MVYKHAEVEKAAKQLNADLDKAEDKKSILRSPVLAALYDQLKTLPQDQRASFGQEVNKLKNELEELVRKALSPKAPTLAPIDITAPFDINTPPDKRSGILPAKNGNIHPLNQELKEVLDIFYRMGF